MLSRELLHAIQDDNIRSQIFERLCSIKHVITTIHTFLEDTKYLEPCTRILKKLLPGKSKGSSLSIFMPCAATSRMSKCKPPSLLSRIEHFLAHMPPGYHIVFS